MEDYRQAVPDVSDGISNARQGTAFVDPGGRECGHHGRGLEFDPPPPPWRFAPLRRRAKPHSTPARWWR
jgi:hypothetical protein